MEKDESNSNEKQWKTTAVIAFIIAICGIIFGVYGMSHIQNGEEPKDNIDFGQIDDVDKATMERLDALTSTVLGAGFGGGEYGRSIYTTSMQGYPISEELIYNGSLSDGAKVATIVNKLWNDKMGVRPMSEEKATLIATTTDKATNELMNVTMLDGGTVENEYYKVYGETIKHRDPKACGSPAYNAAANVYYSNTDLGGCSGIPYIVRGHFYKYNYEMDNDKAYVYIASAAENKNNEICKLNKGSVSDCQAIPDTGVFAINETNYEHFPKYRLVFVKKDDGKYYFEKVESL